MLYINNDILLQLLSYSVSYRNDCRYIEPFKLFQKHYNAIEHLAYWLNIIGFILLLLNKIMTCAS